MQSQELHTTVQVNENTPIRSDDGQGASQKPASNPLLFPDQSGYESYSLHFIHSKEAVLVFTFEVGYTGYRVVQPAANDGGILARGTDLVPSSPSLPQGPVGSFQMKNRGTTLQMNVRHDPNCPAWKGPPYARRISDPATSCDSHRAHRR